MSQNPVYNLEYDYHHPTDNDYLRFINILREQRENLTKADIWAFEHKKKFWQDKYYDQYSQKCKTKLQVICFIDPNIEQDNIIFTQ